MRKNVHKEIEEIPYPQGYVKDLNRLIPILITSMERNGIPIESGLISLGKLDERLRVALFFFHWISDINEIIENLNTVLTDLRDLPIKHTLLKGSPRARYYLLVRTYYNEFYRFRETHHQVVKVATNCGYIKRDDGLLIRKAFHNAFEPTIKIRNNLVHGSPIWTGKTHFDLALVDGAREMGFMLKNRKTRKAWDIGNVLQNLCQHTVTTLHNEGNRLSYFFKKLVCVYQLACEGKRKGA